MDQAKIQERLKKKFGKVQRTGGKGSARKVQRKPPRRNVRQDDKRLQNALKKLNVNPIPAIEEVNLFKKDGSVVHFENPTVQASISANTYVVSGDCETKNIQELLPGILPHLGPDSLEHLKKLAGALQADGALPTDASGSDSDSDDDIPDLVGNFEAVSNEPTDEAAVVEEVDDDDDDDLPELTAPTPATGAVVEEVEESDDDLPELTDPAPATNGTKATGAVVEEVEEDSDDDLPELTDPVPAANSTEVTGAVVEEVDDDDDDGLPELTDPPPAGK